MWKNQFEEDNRYLITSFVSRFDYSHFANKINKQEEGRAKANIKWLISIKWIGFIVFLLSIALFISGLVLDDDMKEKLFISGIIFLLFCVLIYFIWYFSFKFLINKRLKKEISIFNRLTESGHISNKSKAYPESIQMALSSDENWNSSSHEIFKKKNIFIAYIGMSHFFDLLNSYEKSNEKKETIQTPKMPVKSSSTYTLSNTANEVDKNIKSEPELNNTNKTN